MGNSPVKVSVPVKVFDLTLSRILVQYDSVREYRRDTDNRNKKFADYRAFQLVPTQFVQFEEVLSSQTI